MTRWIVAVLAMAALAGCGLHRASLEGHDFLDDGLADLKVGIDEYHADDLERMSVARRKLAAAFAADVVTVADDKVKVGATTEKFLTLLDKAEAAENVEQTRYHGMLNSLKGMAEVNDALRDMAEIKLGWKTAAIEYADKLRKKVQDGRDN